MNHQQHHVLEKIQVEVAAGIALAAVYFGLGAFNGSWDPLAPAVYLVNGAFGHLLIAGLILCVLSAVCSIITCTSRPQGALIAALAGLGGISLHSTGMQNLLWQHPEATGKVFVGLILEVILLGLIVLVAESVVFQVRSIMVKLFPKLSFGGRILKFGTEGTEPQEADEIENHHRVAMSPIWVEVPRMLAESKKSKGKFHELSLTLSAIGVHILVASILIMLFMQSSLRGQVLFSLVAGFCLAGILAHQKFPTNAFFAAWLAPVITAVIFYLLASFTSGAPIEGSTAQIQFYARALPIDWITAGGAGGLLGYWISERIHELRHLEKNA